MKKDDEKILRDVQKNTRMLMKAIDVLSEKVYDDRLSYELSRESLVFSDIHNKAVDELTKDKADVYHRSVVNDLRQQSGIGTSLLLNNSTSKIAEIMLQESNRGVSDVHRSIHHNNNCGTTSVEIAEEFLHFEEKCMEKLRQFL